MTLESWTELQWAALSCIELRSEWHQLPCTVALSCLELHWAWIRADQNTRHDTGVLSWSAVSCIKLHWAEIRVIRVALHCCIELLWAPLSLDQSGSKYKTWHWSIELICSELHWAALSWDQSCVQSRIDNWGTSLRSLATTGDVLEYFVLARISCFS